MANEFRPHNVDEVQIQAQIDQKKYALFNTVPYIVQVDPVRADLETSGHPNDEHTDIDGANQERHHPFQPPHFSCIAQDQCYAVDDYMHNALYLVGISPAIVREAEQMEGICEPVLPKGTL